jgi:hypothetical protein
MKQLESLVDLASDPQVQLADEILEVRERLRRTQVKVDLKRGIEESLQRAQAETIERKSKCLDERKERKAKKERAKRLEVDVLVMVKASRLAELALRKHRGSNGP